MLSALRLFLFVSSIMLLSACASKGEVNPQKEIALTGTGQARITGNSTHNHEFLRGYDRLVMITSLDEESMYRWGWTTEYPESLLISPGKHTIGVQFRTTYGLATGKLWFEAESEKTYIIRTKAQGYGISFWIEDMASGNTIGGVFTGEDPETLPQSAKK